MADTVTGVLAIAGALLVLLSAVGVVRFDDLYARMHAATKASTLGVLLLGAAGIVALDVGRPKIVLAMLFLFITAPTGAHFIGRIAYRAEGVEIDIQDRDDLASVLRADDEVPPPTRAD